MQQELFNNDIKWALSLRRRPGRHRLSSTISCRELQIGMAEKQVPGMVGRISPARSALMAKIRLRDTKPELQLRRGLYARGLRYRTCRKGLPGRPDIVFGPARGG